MPRDLTSSQKAELAKKTFGHVIFVEADLTTGPVRFCTHNGRVKWDGNTYLGSGGLLSLEVIASSNELRSQTFRVGFSYLDANMFDPSTLQRDTFLGRPIRLWYCPFNTAYGQRVDDNLHDDPRLIGKPLLFARGTLDEDELNDDPAEGSGSLTFRVVNHLDILARNSGLLYTNEHQKYLRGEEDDALVNLASIQDYQFSWGGGQRIL